MTVAAPKILKTQFDSHEALAIGVARTIEAVINAAIASRGQAAIALSGGTTPRPAYAKLAEANCDWSKVTIALVDERWVAADDPRSNQCMLQETLLKGASAARFVPLYSASDSDPYAGAPKADIAMQSIDRPFDLVLLGLGSDGHTASLFPGGDTLVEGLNMSSGKQVIAMTAPGADEARVTMTLPAILDAKRIILAFTGPAKVRAYDDALKDGPVEAMPIRAVLHQTQVPVDVFYVEG